MGVIFLYVTARNKVEAVKISHHLLAKKLIACANIFPVTSIYEWKRKIHDEAEVVMILKTLKTKSAVVRKELEKVHSYEVPCIAEIDVKFNDAYADWIRGQLR